MDKYRKNLSEALLTFNLVFIKLINILNYFFVKKSINDRSTIIINTQYVQRYSLVEAIFGNFLKYRGYKVKGLVCAGYNYCEMHKKNVKPPNCFQCRNNTFNLLKAANIESVDLENLNTKSTMNNIDLKEFNLKEVKKNKANYTNYPLGETMYWNWLHYTNGYILPEATIENKKKLIDIYEATVGSYESIENAIKLFKPKYVITCNGKFAQTRPAYYLKDFYNYTCLTWENFAMDNSFVWLRNALSMDQNIHNYWDYVSNLVLSNDEVDKVKKDFQSLKTGQNLKWSFLDKINLTDEKKIYEKLKLDKNKIIVSFFPPIAWDSTGITHFLEDLDFFEIMDFMIKNLKNYENVQLVIRTHPAENNLPDYLKSSVSIIEILKNLNPTMSKNIFLIPGDSEISSHALCSISDELLFYGSTLGLEMLYNKRKVNCIGVQSYYAKKGLSNDIITKEGLIKFFKRLNDIYYKTQRRTDIEYLDDKQHKKVLNLAYYVRFKLRSSLSIIKRGILIPTLFRYFAYIKYSRNLQSYLEKKKLPFDLNS